MVKRSPSGYTLKIGDREFLAEAHTLRDGGLLCQLDGNSHVVYGEEEAAGTRLLIGGKPCLLQVRSQNRGELWKSGSRTVGVPLGIS